MIICAWPLFRGNGKDDGVWRILFFAYVIFISNVYCFPSLSRAGEGLNRFWEWTILFYVGINAVQRNYLSSKFLISYNIICNVEIVFLYVFKCKNTNSALHLIPQDKLLNLIDMDKIFKKYKFICASINQVLSIRQPHAFIIF